MGKALDAAWFGSKARQRSKLLRNAFLNSQNLRNLDVIMSEGMFGEKSQLIGLLWKETIGAGGLAAFSRSLREARSSSSYSLYCLVQLPREGGRSLAQVFAAMEAQR